MGDIIESSARTGFCDRCGDPERISVAIIRDGGKVRLCGVCIVDNIRSGYRVANFTEEVSSNHCTSCAEVTSSLWCSTCAEENVRNGCDECDDRSVRVLCQEHASAEWNLTGGCEAYGCDNTPILCSYHAECESCSERAVVCDNHRESECQECSDTATYCETCADSKHSCDNCGDSIDDGSLCSTCAARDCTICGRHVKIEDIVCPTCRKSKVADGVVTFDPGNAYRVHYSEKE